MAPRLTILRLYAEAKGLDPQVLERVHLQYLGTYQYWIQERLELLGYGAEDAEPLRLRPEEVAEAVDAVLEAFRSGPEAAAALPPPPADASGEGRSSGGACPEAEAQRGSGE